MGYSPERKSAVLKRMLPPNNLAIRQLSQDEGISKATLHKWRAEARSKGQLLPDADTGPGGREFGREPRTCAWEEPEFSTGTDATGGACRFSRT